MLNMYSPTLLASTPNQLVSCPWLTDHNFFIWANPDFVVHRYDRGLKSWQIKLSTEEHMDEYLEQYGTNEMLDLSGINPRIDDLPLATQLVVPEPTLPS